MIYGILRKKSSVIIKLFIDFMTDIIDNIFIKGPAYTVEFAVLTDGTMPANDDLLRIKKKDLRKYSRLKMICRQLSITGHLPETKLGSQAGTILKKFKHSEMYPLRVICYFEGKHCIITNTYMKKGDTHNNNQFKIAETIKDEYTRWKKKARP